MSELWTVALFFRGHGRQVNLLYGGEAAARDAFVQVARGAEMVIGDHYGSTVAIFEPAMVVSGDGAEIKPIERSGLEAVMLQDNTKAHDGAIEGSLIQARAQAKANTRAQHDPQLKFVAGAGGPLMGMPG
jgi:hypothetical protein